MLIPLAAERHHISLLVTPVYRSAKIASETEGQVPARRNPQERATGPNVFSAQSVIRDMWNAMFNSKVVIADCTGRNPNVFYEIGTAHVLGKPVILITQAVEDIPFDLRYIRFILYEFTPRGMSLFEKRLQATIKQEMGRVRTATLVELGSKHHIPWPTAQLDPKEPCHCGSGKRHENGSDVALAPPLQSEKQEA